MYAIAYVVKSGKTQIGRARDAKEAIEKIRLYRAAGVTHFSVSDEDGRSVRLDELPALADLGH